MIAITATATLVARRWTGKAKVLRKRKKMWGPSVVAAAEDKRDKTPVSWDAKRSNVAEHLAGTGYPWQYPRWCWWDGRYKGRIFVEHARKLSLLGCHKLLLPPPLILTMETLGGGRNKTTGPQVEHDTAIN